MVPAWMGCGGRFTVAGAQSQKRPFLDNVRLFAESGLVSPVSPTHISEIKKRTVAGFV